MSDPAIDREAMGRLAKALTFIVGADDPTTVALREASETGMSQQITRARQMFLRLKSGDRKAALAMLDDDD